MKHLIICREYPPAPFPPGGIGTYVVHISQLLAEAGETVHVIAQQWEGAAKEREEKCEGNLIIHRVPIGDRDSFLPQNSVSENRAKEVKGLFQSNFCVQSFSWQASLLAEQLIEQEKIDIIEAQEHEAPLFYFQLRRALGLGPKHNVPCIVHLHSPTEFIVLHNDWDIYYSPTDLHSPRWDWDLNRTCFQTIKRLENYTIAAADAVLCPSRYLARQVEDHLGMAEATVQVIPYPFGGNPLIERDQKTWEGGTICYVGRLERRKGIIEWIDAAVSVAEENSTIEFAFIGANCLDMDEISGEELIARRIPTSLKPRFHFYGKQDRSNLPNFLKQARIAVVPSRWENFPNTCVEAMCSGLPVVISPNGGMAEMVRDEQTGWVAKSIAPKDLADALKRALKTPPSRLAEMGRQAASDIREICDNQKTLERQLEFRQQLTERGAHRSFFLPTNLPWGEQPLADNLRRKVPQNILANGIAVVINYFREESHLLKQCLQGLLKQTRFPTDVIVIVDDETVNLENLRCLNQLPNTSWTIVYNRIGNLATTKNDSIEKVLSSGSNPLGFVFLDVEYVLQPDFIEACESILKHCPEVGLVSCWTQHLEPHERLWSKPCPSFPHQWLSNEAAPFSAIRTESLIEVGKFRPIMCQGYEDWDLFNAVMVAGWVAVTLPAILAEHRFGESPKSYIPSAHTHGRMLRELLERFPEEIARDAKKLAFLNRPKQPWSQHEEFIQLQQQTDSSQVTPAVVQETARQILWEIKDKGRQTLWQFREKIKQTLKIS